MNKGNLPTKFDDDFIGHMTIQNYSSQSTIDGVRIVDLRVFADDSGSFNELARFGTNGETEDFNGFHIAQCSYTELLPGAIKAWHLHAEQTDIWFVPPLHRLLVGLLDIRSDSPTSRVSLRFIMGAGRAQLLFIPPGVAHGAANLWLSTAAVFYLVDAKFDPQDPDELRLPWDVLGEAFWSIHPG